MRVTAVILAAGRGCRMGGSENKVFLPIGGFSLLTWTLSALMAASRINEIVVVAQPEDVDRIQPLCPAGRIQTSIVPGGAVRRDSAVAGVQAASGEIVLIHDGARPFPSLELIDRVIDGAVEHGACIPILPVVDTLRRVDERLVRRDPIDRTGLVRVQTPQGFRTSLIRRALPLSSPDAPDDAAAVLALGERVWTVAGEPINLKVTTSADLPLAEDIAGRLHRPTSESPPAR